MCAEVTSAMLAGRMAIVAFRLCDLAGDRPQLK